MENAPGAASASGLTSQEETAITLPPSGFSNWDHQFDKNDDESSNSDESSESHFPDDHDHHDHKYHDHIHHGHDHHNHHKHHFDIVRWLIHEVDCLVQKIGPDKLHIFPKIPHKFKLNCDKHK